MVLLSLGDFSDFMKAESFGDVDADGDRIPDDMAENYRSFILFGLFVFASMFL